MDKDLKKLDIRTSHGVVHLDDYEVAKIKEIFMTHNYLTGEMFYRRFIDLYENYVGDPIKAAAEAAGVERD